MLTAAALLLLPPAAWTQTAATQDFPLLAPKLDGDPLHPPAFRKPGPLPSPLTVPSPVGQLPNFDDQPGIGAGSTGFNSSNTRRKPPKNSAPPSSGMPIEGAVVEPKPSATPVAQPFLAPPPTTSAIGDARLIQNQNRTRRGAPSADAVASTGAAALAAAPAAGTNPTAANAPGAVLQGAAPSTALPALDPAPSRTLTRRPIVDDKPFDPVGIGAGSFRLRPAIEGSGGYDSNPARTTPGGGGSYFGIVAPELLANSNWSRHELTADLRGSYISYATAPSFDRPAFNGKIDGRVDVTSLTRLDLESRLVVATDNPGSPNIQAGLARLPISADVGGSVGLGQRFNRLDVALKGGVDRTTYQNSTFTDGTTASNDDRNFDQYSALLRTSYESTPGMKPFVELDVDRRHHDLAVDRSGFERDSDGRAGKIGSTFELSRILTGQVAFGYLERSYADPRLATLKGPTFDGSLTWVASALTTVKLTAATIADESTLAGVSGVFTHEVGIEVDHAFRTWLEASLKLTGDRDNYVGITRRDDRYAAAAALTYKLTREWQVKAELRREWLTSNTVGNDYNAYVAMLGVRLQR